MLFNRLPKLNWAYAAGEVLLIFIGVTAAFMFDAWREGQKSLENEIAILREISEDLEATQEDLLLDAGSTEEVLAAQTEILRMLANSEREEAADLGQKIRAASSAAILFPKVSGYRALLNIGLDTISDPSLRSALTSFYELRLSRIRVFEESAASHMEGFVDIVAPFTELTWPVSGPRNRDASGQPPVHSFVFDDEALLEERSFALRLIRFRSATNTVLQQYREADQELRMLQAALREHQATLE